MITEFTPDQQEKIQEYRARYWQQVIATEPADRERAEAAAQRLAEIGGVKINNVTWVNSPAAGEHVYRATEDLLRESLQISINASLQDLLNAPLSAPILESLQDTLRSVLQDALRNSINVTSMPLNIMPLNISISTDLLDALNALLWDSLQESLRVSMKKTTRHYSTWGPLRHSIHDSLRRSPWLAYCGYMTEVLGVECSSTDRELLALQNEIAASCFALWIMPGSIILCERPESVEVDDGKLVDLTWRKGD